MNRIKYPMPMFAYRRKRLARILTQGMAHYDPFRFRSNNPFVTIHSPYMCKAIKLAWYDREISEKDAIFAIKYINQVIHPDITLVSKLNRCDLPHEPHNLVAFYKQWIYELEKQSG